MSTFVFQCDSCGFEAEVPGTIGQPPVPTGCLAYWSEWACTGTMRRVYTPLVAPAFPGSHKDTYRSRSESGTRSAS